MPDIFCVLSPFLTIGALAAWTLYRRYKTGMKKPDWLKPGGGILGCFDDPEYNAEYNRQAVETYMYNQISGEDDGWG